MIRRIRPALTRLGSRCSLNNDEKRQSIRMPGRTVLTACAPLPRSLRRHASWLVTALLRADHQPVTIHPPAKTHLYFLTHLPSGPQTKPALHPAGKAPVHGAPSSALAWHWAT